MCLQNLTNIKLTKGEEKLLEVLVSPDNRHKSITELCELADCSRTFYYNCFKKDEFKKAYEDITKDLVKQAIGPVINTFIKEAKRGSFQHGKVLLEMANMYTEKQEVKSNNINDNTIRIKLEGDLKEWSK